MSRSFYADDLNRLERRLNRLERRGQWGGAMRTVIEPFDFGVALVASPGDETSQLLYVHLDPGRWEVFASAVVTASSAHVCVFNLRIVDDLGWDGTLTSISTNRDTDAVASQNVLGGHWATPHVFTTTVLDHPMWVTFNGVRSTTSPASTVRVAQLFAKPG